MVHVKEHSRLHNVFFFASHVAQMGGIVLTVKPPVSATMIAFSPPSCLSSASDSWQLHKKERLSPHFSDRRALKNHTPVHVR